eukprot:gene1099-1192_t
MARTKKGKRRFYSSSNRENEEDEEEDQRQSKRIRFDEDDNIIIVNEEEGFLRFPSTASTTPSGEEGSEEDREEESDLAVTSVTLLPDLPKPWRGHIPYNSVEKSSSTIPPLVRLHNEILEFCSFISPSPRELDQRKALFEEIQAVVSSLWPTSRLEVFGSQMTQLLTPTSDMDLAVLDVEIPDHEDQSMALASLASRIKQHMQVSYVEAIVNAKVPIVKFDHSATGISVDICLNNDSGVRTGKIMVDYMREFPALKPLLCVLKVYLAQRRMSETYTGGIGSFVLASMIVSFLQMRQHTAHFTGISPLASYNVNLGCLLMAFLHLYGVSFNFYATGINLLNGGEYFSKMKRQQLAEVASTAQNRPGLLTIVNPDQPDQDMGKNSFLLPKIRRAFEHTHQLLAAALKEEKRDSYLAFIIRGDDAALVARQKKQSHCI